MLYLRRKYNIFNKSIDFYTLILYKHPNYIEIIK
uniref:Uncharacterized protein n=1 Tax=virus sp. ctmTa7 TaxID=2828255 RepID=A0A8S5RBL6_9VIRU|nr:MAG TPA: hypothetical protein [virus sp. ctmTa7]DAU18414.1 MAG TPA: hypothetical protein [Bacteriophage sp.]